MSTLAGKFTEHIKIKIIPAICQRHFIHLNRVRAYEAGDVEKGTVFEIPVTVVQPITLNVASNWQHKFDSVTCKPNTILRHFILVPNNATWAGKLNLFFI